MLRNKSLNLLVLGLLFAAVASSLVLPDDLAQGAPPIRDDCLSKNAFMPRLREKNVRISTIPETTSQGCPVEFTAHGNCCNVEDVKKLLSK